VSEPVPSVNRHPAVMFGIIARDQAKAKAFYAGGFGRACAFEGDPIGSIQPFAPICHDTLRPGLSRALASRSFRPQEPLS
jgi:hypothetical protein